jgi:UDP-N-acetyl-D-mannosaminuronic acid dehydrogenase
MKKNYPRARDIPRAGFAAGPCLFKDTMQLAAFSNHQFSLGHSAMEINEGLALYVVDEIARSYPLKDTTIGLLGMAFKPEIDDTRSSLSYKLKKVLSFRAKKVYCTDPFVDTDPELISASEVVAQSDVLVLCTPHRVYRELDLKGKTLVDVWSYINKGPLMAKPRVPAYVPPIKDRPRSLEQ